MKKIILLGLLLQYSAVTFGQSSAGVYYGTTGSLGFDFTYSKNYIVGGGVSLSIASSKTIGDDYTDKNFTAGFSDQIINSTVEQKTISLYLIGGYRYKMFKLMGKIGYGSVGKYNNYYDPSKVFGSNGYYFKNIDSNGSLLIGTSLGINVSKKVSLDFGFDTYNGVTIGSSYDFN